MRNLNTRLVAFILLSERNGTEWRGITNSILRGEAWIKQPIRFTGFITILRFGTCSGCLIAGSVVLPGICILTALGVPRHNQKEKANTRKLFDVYTERAVNKKTMGREKAARSCDELELVCSAAGTLGRLSPTPGDGDLFVAESSGGTNSYFQQRRKRFSSAWESNRLGNAGNLYERGSSVFYFLYVVSAVSTRHRTDVKLVDLCFFIFLLPACLECTSTSTIFICS